MTSQVVTLKLPDGLNSKRCSLFVQKTNSFNSKIWLETPTHQINAKSLLCVLSLGLAFNSEFTIVADGKDEEAAVSELAAMCV